jgi:hypothetical protein
MSGFHEFEESRARAVMQGRLNRHRAIFELSGYFICSQIRAEQKLDEWIDRLTREDARGPVVWPKPVEESA